MNTSAGQWAPVFQFASWDENNPDYSIHLSRKKM